MISVDAAAGNRRTHRRRRHIALAARADTRERIANSPQTRRFLELGLGLLREDLLQHAGPVLDGSDKSRLFDAISRERILRLAPDDELSANMFRRRWSLKNHYTEDLIAYLFRLGPQRHRLDAMDRTSCSAGSWRCCRRW